MLKIIYIDPGITERVTPGSSRIVVENMLIIIRCQKEMYGNKELFTFRRMIILAAA